MVAKNYAKRSELKRRRRQIFYGVKFSFWANFSKKSQKSLSLFDNFCHIATDNNTIAGSGEEKQKQASHDNN